MSLATTRCLKKWAPLSSLWIWHRSTIFSFLKQRVEAILLHSATIMFGAKNIGCLHAVTMATSLHSNKCSRQWPISHTGFSNGDSNIHFPFSFLSFSSHPFHPLLPSTFHPLYPPNPATVSAGVLLPKVFLCILRSKNTFHRIKQTQNIIYHWKKWWSKQTDRNYMRYARFMKHELSRESQVIPGTRNSSVLATANLGLSSK